MPSPEHRPAPPPLDSLRAELDSLRRRGHDAVNEGRYEEALLLYEHALELTGSRPEVEADLVDLFVVNRAAVRIELAEDGHAELEGDLVTLREVLGRTTSVENGLLASFQIARVYEQRREFKKALFYARMARDRSGWVETRGGRALSFNLLANVLLAESQVEDAAAAYQEALASLADGDDIARARIRANLGYCWLLQGRERDGLAAIHGALRMLARRRLARFCVSPHIDLAFAHLQLDRPRSAGWHAKRALVLATTYREREGRKNALYLLGEAAVRLESQQAAREAFETLQREFYPDNPALVDHLLAVDVVPMLNLRA